MRIWAYCKGCEEWFACFRGIDGVVADWRCPVCGLQPVSVQQSDGAPDEPGLTEPAGRRGGEARVRANGVAARGGRTAVAATELRVRRGNGGDPRHN